MSMHPEHDLTSEELAMAEWLRATDSVRGPGAGIDASILKMAAAAEPARLPRRQRPPTWIGPLGLVATVCLVSFVLWRYQVVDTLDQEQAQSTASMVSAPAVPDKSTPDMAWTPAAVPADAQSPRTVTNAAPSAVPAPKPSARAIASESARPAVAPTTAAAPPSALAEPIAASPVAPAATPMAAAAAPPPPPPAPVAARAAVQERAHAKRIATVTVPSANWDQDAPDVSADSRDGPAQWLQRIQDRLANNDIAGTRESLRLYLERYPSAEIPAELERYRPRTR